MGQTLTAPEHETFPDRKRWTIQDCMDFMEQGRLDGRWELIDGEIISKMGQKPPHRSTLHLILQWLVSHIGIFHIQVESPIRISGEYQVFNEPEPDIAVTKETSSAYFLRHPAPEDLELIVEIADSSLRLDLNTKALLYARAGVPEYWVADVAGRCIIVHRSPDQFGYSDVKKYDEAAFVALENRPNTSVQVSALLPPG